MKSITKEMTITECLEVDELVTPILMRAGMHCLGCPSSLAESFEEACMVHGLDCDILLKNINTILATR